MRLSGAVESAGGFRPHGHLGWGYRDRPEFRARAAEFIADGLALGQWVEYVGEGSAATLSADLTTHGLGAKGPGELSVCPVDEFYAYCGDGDGVDPVASVDKRVAAAKEAIAAGYTGFRAVVDATAVARTPSQREAFARFEHLIDRQMSVLPVSAICAYDAEELGDCAVAEMACLHPVVNTGAASFRLYADQDVDLTLAGDVDFACTELFSLTLRRTLPLLEGTELVIDGRDLDFIDHRGLFDLDQQGRALGRRIVLRSGSPTVARVAELLDLRALRVEVLA